MSNFCVIIQSGLLDPYRNDVFTIVFFVLAIMMATVWNNFLIVFFHKLRDMVLSNDSRSFEVENMNSGTRLRIVLMLVTLVSVSIFVFKLCVYVKYTNLFYWQVLLGVVGIHLLRILLTRFIEYVFNAKGGYEIWFDSYSWIHYSLGVIFFPLAILMTYSPSASFSICANLALIAFVLSELLFFYRLISVFYNGLVSLCYLFLYLCALEILPLLTVYRILF